MAEFVEFRMEELIPEMEELERLGIMSNKEVKKLIQKRKDFEYRLARRSKRKADFISYINYEKKILELIRIRRKLLGVHEKRHQIEASISRRMVKQARLLTRLWPSHLDTWALRISFSHFVGWKDEISNAYTEQVNFHGNCESVWVAWAKWEIEERKNFDKARAILLSKAPLYHPKSCLIKRELFRLELLYVEMLMNKVKHDNIAGLEEVIAENREKVLNCAVARAVYLNAVNTLPEPELYLQLYQVADKFEFAHQLREEIYRDLCTKYPGTECLWKLKAKRLISGLGDAFAELCDTNDKKDVGTGNAPLEMNKPSDCAELEKKETHEKSDKDDGFDVDKVKTDVIKEESDEEVEGEDSGVEEEKDIEQENSDLEKEEEEGNEIEREENDADEKLEEKSDEESMEKADDKMTKGKKEEEVQQDSGSEDEDSNSEDMEDKEDEEEHNEGIEEKNKAQSMSRDINSASGAMTISQDIQQGPPSVVQGSLNLKDILPASTEKLDPKGKLELLIIIFDKALEVIGEKFVHTYIDELLPMVHQCWGKPDMTTIIYKKLVKLFDQYTTLLSPLHFYIWYQVLCHQSEDKNKARTVLESGVKQHPAASHLQLELARWIVREADTDAQIMKEFQKIGSSLKGECGLTALKEFAKHVCKDSNKKKLFKAAMDHEDQTVARGMRILYLQDMGLQEGITGARKLYQNIKWRPPFCGHLQAKMVELELAQDTVNVQCVREVFNTSIQQQGFTNPGIWLAYAQFEKKHGDALKTGGLLTRAEKELEAQQAHVFRELRLIIQDSVKKETTPMRSEQSDNYFIERTEDEESELQDAEPQPTLASLFEEELTLSYTANNARNSFFRSIHSMKRNMKRGNKSTSGDNGTEWEKVLELLVGHKIILSIQEVKVEAVPKKKVNKLVKNKLVKPRFKGKYEPTDQLNPGEGKNVKTVNEDDVEKILASSDVLKPDFMQKTSLTPYFMSKKKAKKIRKEESIKTKGPGWFNMKAPELTEEAKRDLEVLQMRSVLDPKRHYKNDMKVLPKYFQLAEVVDSPVDFYSSRVPKKKRKRTMAEEIMHDEEALRYQKKKYTEIIASRQKKQFKHPNALKKKKTKNISTKK